MERYDHEAASVLEDPRFHYDIFIEANAAGRAKLIRLYRAGLIEAEVMHTLERHQDVEQMALYFHSNES